MAADTRVEWSVDEAAHAAFVERSGDRNPIHVDQAVARRLPFGRIVVHGMHLVLDAVERAETATRSSVARVAATFRHPVGIGDALVTEIAFDGDTARATVWVDVWVAAEMRFDLQSVPGSVRSTVPGSGTRSSAATGVLELTRLIGMEVPGEHSLFSSFDVAIGDPTRPLEHRVVVDDPRFSRMVLELDGALIGTATAFVRPQPVEPAIGDTAPEPDEFAGQRWLVVGGSRGLGAIAVLLLDAGGADVRFTYRTGDDDAARLASRTARATAQQFDADAGTPLDVAEWRPTHLAYMASPPIFVGAAGTYSRALFEQFRRVYVDAFLELVARLDRGDGLRGVVWPSSIAVETSPPGMAEYVDAKLAGEQACRELATERPHIHVVTPRFPRLLTDQTTSFVPVEYGDAPAEVLAALRSVIPSPQR